MATTEAPVHDADLTGTAAHLLDVAEHLFAEKGLGNVSIREIVRASGQNNLSAAHYHFGSRNALLAAMLTRRIRVINALRHKALDNLVASGRADTVHAIVAASFGVLADAVRTMPWGVDYVRVAAQGLFSPQMHLWELLDAGSISGHVRCNAMLRVLLPDLPQDVFNERILILNNQAAYSIARWVQTNGAVTAASMVQYAQMVQNTTDFLAAGVAAPVGGRGGGVSREYAPASA